MNPIQSILLTTHSWLRNRKAVSAAGLPIVHPATACDAPAPATPQPAPAHASIGRHNQELMDALTNAKRVAITLARSGHRVLDISVGSRNARVTLHPSPRCNLLGGAMIKITRLHGVEKKTMATNLDGVQVEWTLSTPLGGR
ncbi:hypothetical protein [Nitrosomonas halophila]|uniref:Uncharacterized protein n=1 Tax=Nitrosomonas halophila TaxID=44576 RepID=A0A1H3FER8_9PROT|nr:hypothetical protein [Nitrosomonas halophila]SDX89375.1 hypothetical protein SAMN05421881_101170 [Nitrosomonas halophila]